ncbi:MAG: type II toxin-antitoxin system RelE/ParE family toxin [Methylotenera sp.]|nr:type II toxin-antitoxin system RelE/ParE family toxin [Methylotenera sp.]
MPQIIWTRTSLTDVQRLYRFLAQRNQYTAQRAVATIKLRVAILKNHPQIGRPADEMDTKYKELLIDFGDSGYIALYRHDDEVVTVLAIRHQRELGFN